MGCMTTMAADAVSADGQPALTSAGPVSALAVLPASLDGFQGPDSGTVEVPVRIFWSGNRVFDLAQDADVEILYQALFRNGSPSDIAERVNGRLLVRAWPNLSVPPRKRQLMEDRYAELRRARLARVPVTAAA